MFDSIIEIPIKSYIAKNDENMYHGERSLLVMAEKIVWDARAILRNWISTLGSIVTEAVGQNSIVVRFIGPMCRTPVRTTKV
jgi:hypothetical protein